MAPEVDKRVWSKVQNVVVSANIFAKLPLEKLAVILALAGAAFYGFKKYQNQVHSLYGLGVRA